MTLVAALVLCLATLVGGCSSPAATEAQVHKIAFLRSVAIPNSLTDSALLAELSRHGFVKGRNLEILGGEGEEAYPDEAEAANAVSRWQSQGVDVVLAFSTRSVEIARAHAPQAAVVFLVNDPVVAGFVGQDGVSQEQMTGLTFRVPADRMFALMQRIRPGLQRVGLAFPPDDPAAVANREAFDREAQARGLQLVVEDFAGEEDIDRAVAVLVQQEQVGFLIASVSPTGTRALGRLGEAATAHGLPVAANVGTFEAAVLTVFPDSESVGRLLGRKVARILAGAVPEEVPVEDPNRYRIHLNERKALELGITLPPDLIREADHVLR